MILTTYKNISKERKTHDSGDGGGSDDDTVIAVTAACDGNGTVWRILILMAAMMFGAHHVGDAQHGITER
jgi:hypothetical protein